MQIIVSLLKSFKRREDLEDYWTKLDLMVERLKNDGFNIEDTILKKHRDSSIQEKKSTYCTDIFWMIINIDEPQYDLDGNSKEIESIVWLDDRPFPTCYRFINERQDALILEMFDNNYDELIRKSDRKLLESLYYERWKEEHNAMSSTNKDIDINSLKGLKKKEIVLIVKDYGEELTQKGKGDLKLLFEKLENDGFKIGKELNDDDDDDISSFKIELNNILSPNDYHRIEGLISMKNKTLSLTRSAIYSKSIKCSNANLPRIDRILNNYDKLFSKKSTSKAVLDVYSNGGASD